MGMLAILSSKSLRKVAREGSNVLEYTERWLTLVNRGGLFLLNDDPFSFFIHVERCDQIVLPKHVLSPLSDDQDSFKQDVHDGIVSDEDVQFFWALLSQEIRWTQKIVMSFFVKWSSCGSQFVATHLLLLGWKHTREL